MTYDIPSPVVGDTLEVCNTCGALRCLHGGAQEEG